MTRKLMTMCTALLLAVSVLPFGVKAEESEQTEEMTAETNNDPFNEESEIIPEEAEPELIDVKEEAELSDLSAEGTAYAVFTEEKELIFFRSTKTYSNQSDGIAEDIKGNRYSGKIYTGIETLEAGNTWDGIMKVPWRSEISSVHSVSVAKDQVIRPVSMSHWFNGSDNLERFDAAGFDTSDVKDMSYMFKANDDTDERGQKLTVLDLSSFDTSKVTDMNCMFQYQTKLRELNIHGFDTSNVTAMNNMFESCHELEYVDVTTFDTSKVTDMSYMFCGCWTLTDLDVSGFDLSSAENTPFMFGGCGSLATLDVTDLKSSNVINMRGMFNGCTGLTSLDLTGFDTSSAIDLSNLFAGCSGLTSLDLSPLNTSACQNMSNMFADCTGLKTIDLSPLDTALVTNMSEMFARSGFTELDLSSFNTPNLQNMWSMFSNCRNLKTLNLKGMKTSAVTQMTDLFYNCRSLKTLDLSSFDTQNVTTMSCMFWNCRNLESIDLSSFNTSKVLYMYFMFNTCVSLKSLDLSSFDTSNVIYMYRLFYDCAALETLDISGFNTANVSEMDELFTGAYSLKSLKLGPQFTKWEGEYDTALPAGKWTNSVIGKTLSETELPKQYPANAKNWAGTWERTEVKYIPVTGIEVDAEDEWLFPKTIMGLINANVLPKNATNRRIIWSSSDSDVVEVCLDENDDFNAYSISIEAHKAGKAVITAKTEDGGYSRSFMVTVGFDDVTDTKSYYYEPVYWAYLNEITTGTSAYTFSPNDKCTRGHIVTFLWRMMGEPAVDYDMPFTDVKEDKFYYDAIAWAASKGITTGTSATTFSPNEVCNRGQIVTFLWRAMGQPEPETASDFTDVTSNKFFYKAVSWAAENNITTGTSPTTFSPNDSCTRGHAVTFLYRTAQLSE